MNEMPHSPHSPQSLEELNHDPVLTPVSDQIYGLSGNVKPKVFSSYPDHFLLILLFHNP